MDADELLAEAMSMMQKAIKSGDWKPDGACDPYHLFWAIEIQLRVAGFRQNSIDGHWMREAA